MYFEFNDDQRTLRDVVRRLLDVECPAALLRAAWPGGDESLLAPVWRKLAGVGIFGSLVGEDAGGIGLDETYLVALLEQTGYAGLPLPSVETVAVAAPLLAGDPTRTELLAGLLSGETLITAQLGPPDADGTVLVPYAQLTATAIILAPGGPALVATTDAEPVSSVDGARRLARVRLASVDPIASRAEDLELARNRAAVGSAAELIGLSRRMLAMTVDYVGQRKQFGVPVGSFQAIKHHLADALLAVEFAAPAVRRAGHSLATRDSNAARDVAAAKALASDAAVFVSRATIQCHGAIAYTTEYDHHLFAKRAWAQSQAYGNAAWHRQRLAILLGLVAEGSTHLTERIAS